MFDVLLTFGKLILVALLFGFLFLVMRTGIGLVKGSSAKQNIWQIIIKEGPSALKGLKMSITSPLTIGRSAGADIMTTSEFVSGRHTRILPPVGTIGEEGSVANIDLGVSDKMARGPIVEDLGSTNGTLVNGVLIEEPIELETGDIIEVGDILLQVNYLG